MGYKKTPLFSTLVWNDPQKLTNKKDTLKTVFVRFAEFQDFPISPYQMIRDMAVEPAHIGRMCIYKTRPKSGRAAYFPPLPLHQPP